MKRKIDDFLIHWKNEEDRKPLIIYGSKGVGKTYTSILFGQKNLSEEHSFFQYLLYYSFFIITTQIVIISIRGLEGLI